MGYPVAMRSNGWRQIRLGMSVGNLNNSSKKTAHNIRSYPKKATARTNVRCFMDKLSLEISKLLDCSEAAYDCLKKDQYDELLKTLLEANKCTRVIRNCINDEGDRDKKNDNRHSALIHDLKSIVTAVICYTELSLMICDNEIRGEKLAETLLSIQECARVAKQKIDEKTVILGFEDNLPQSLNEIFQTALILSEPRRQKIGEVRIILDVPQKQIILTKNKADFVRMFMNLFNNSLDALLERKETVGKKFLHVHVQSLDDAIKINVIDNGMGMSCETMDKMFKPFFTTKGGKGTGVGLYFCKELVEGRCGGKISAISNIGIGTDVTIEIPKAKL